MRNVFIDTSVWVEYFRGRDAALCDRVEQLVMDGRAGCDGVVLGELLHGARGVREAEEIRKAFLALHVYSDTLDVFAEAGHLGAELRRKGVTIPLTDCVIAAQARRENLTLLTADRHFAAMAGHARLTLELAPTPGKFGV
jgi:predicted nucleic acid-binding protein